MPPVLIPIYQQAAAAYGLGPQGAAVLAGINEIETAFGSNLNVSSAGAMGWMQFIPSSWEAYGVDANGDGVSDPYNPEDAIHAAANYLSAAGMPEDTYDAIFAYNHADWYVEDVLANAACYAGVGSSRAVGGFSLTPKLQVLSCSPAEDWREGDARAEYLTAFEGAAARYELGRSGRLGAGRVARLESNFGRGMGKRQMQKYGPLGLDGDRVAALRGRRRRGRPHPPRRPRRLGRDAGADDLVARRPPRRHLHPQPGPVVRRGGARRGRAARRAAASCSTVDWAVALPESPVAPINWENLTLSNELELQDLTSGRIDPRIVGLIGAITQEHQLTHLLAALRPLRCTRPAATSPTTTSAGRWTSPRSTASPAPKPRSTAPAPTWPARLAYLPAPVHPTELIYCFDVDGPGAGLRPRRPLRSHPRRLRRLEPAVREDCRSPPRVTLRANPREKEIRCPPT